MACIHQTPLDTSEVSQARGGERIYAGQTLLQRLNESAGINHPPQQILQRRAPSNSHLSKIRERPHLDVQSGQMDCSSCTSVPSKCVCDAARVVLSSAETKGSLQVAMERIMKNTIGSQSASLPLVHCHRRPQKQTQSPERMHSPRGHRCQWREAAVRQKESFQSTRTLTTVVCESLFWFLTASSMVSSWLKFHSSRIESAGKINFVFVNLNLFKFSLEWQTNAFFSASARCALVYYTG